MPDNYDDQQETKVFPVSMPVDLFDAFYRVFPHYGSRSIFIRECIRAALKQLSVVNGTLNLPDAVKIALESPALRIRIANVNER